MAKKHHFDFQVVITQALQGLGVQQNKHEGYDWQLDTRAGLLRLHPVETGLNCRFENIERANQVVHLGHLNRSTGEWNHRFNKPSSVDVDYVVWQLELIIEGCNPAPSFSGYCPMWEKMHESLLKHWRDSGITVIEETEPSDGPEFTVRFPPNRPKSPPKP